jgi:hypothetical protein
MVPKNGKKYYASGPPGQKKRRFLPSAVSTRRSGGYQVYHFVCGKIVEN